MSKQPQHQADANRTRTPARIRVLDCSDRTISPSALMLAPAVIMKLQRTIGNQAVQRLLRADAEDVTPDVNRNSESAMLTVKPQLQITHNTASSIARTENVEEVLKVARDLLIDLGDPGMDKLTEELTKKKLDRVADIEHKLKGVADGKSPRAGDAKRLLDEINQKIGSGARQTQLNRKLGEARDLLQKHRWGSWQPDRVPGADHIEHQLGEMAGHSKGTEEGKRAKELQDQIKRLRTRVSELDKARQASAGGTAAYKGGSSVGKNATKAEQTVTKPRTTGVKAGQSATKAETALVKVGSESVDVLGDAAKASRLAKLGSILTAVLPGPLDVLGLWIGFFGSLAEAKQKLSEEYYLLGFVKGLAANLLGFTPDWMQQQLQYRRAYPTIGERVAGFEGVREKANNQGVVAGWRFASKLTFDQRNAFQQDGFATIAQKKQRIGHQTGPGEDDYGFNIDDVLALGVALMPRIQNLLEVAKEQEEARRRKAQRKTRMENRIHPGMF